MGPQQGPVDSPQLAVSSNTGLSRPRDLEELTSPAPINLYISEAGDYNHSVSGQCNYISHNPSGECLAVEEAAIRHADHLFTAYPSVNTE